MNLNSMNNLQKGNNNIETVELQGHQDWVNQKNVPPVISATVDSILNIKISFDLNPFYLRGAFDNSPGLDYAVHIVNEKTDEEGILILHSYGKKCSVIGAGNNFYFGGRDFSWMDVWFVYTETHVNQGPGETKSITLSQEAIWVEKSESASALIYWDGSQFKWYQQGD